MSLAIFTLAALAEIAGCFAVWSVTRLGKPAWLLIRAEADFAGHAFAAYGGIYIAASLGWIWVVEGARAVRFDLAGAALCLGCAALILFAPRSA